MRGDNNLRVCCVCIWRVSTDQILARFIKFLIVLDILGIYMKKLTQQQKLLKLLQEAGNTGVNSFDLTYIYSIKQAPTRVWELQQKGYSIMAVDCDNKSVQYVLTNEPVEQIKTPRKRSSIEDYDVVVKNFNTVRLVPKVLESGSGSPKTTASNFENFRQDSLI